MRFFSRRGKGNVVRTPVNERSVKTLGALRRAAFVAEGLEERRLFAAELTLQKIGLPTPIVDAGGQMTYQITVVNTGTNFAQNVVITDTYSTAAVAGLATFVSARQLGGPTFNIVRPAVGSTGDVTFSIGQLNSTVSAVFEVVLDVDPVAPDGSVITNTASVVRDLNSTPADPDFGDNPFDNTQTVNTTVAVRADLQITKDMLPIQGAPAPVDPDSVVAGLDVQYRITVTNNGTANAENVIMRDVIPQYTTFVDFIQESGPTFALNPNPAIPRPGVGQAGTAEAAILTLAPGATAEFLLTLHVSSSAPDDKQVFNTAVVSSDTFDPALGNNLFTRDAEIQIMTDIRVVSSPDKINRVYEGTFFPYTFSIINAGPSDAQQVTVNWQTPNFADQPLIPAELGVFWDTTGTAPAVFQRISGPAFTVVAPNPPPAGVGPRGNFTGALATLPAGVGSTYQFWVGTPQQQDVIQRSSGGTASPDVNPANNTWVDNHHIYDAPLVIQTMQNISAVATQPIDLQVMTFIDTNAWPGNIATPNYNTPGGRFFEMEDFNATVNWGDGTASAAVISLDLNGIYRVTAQHVYAAPGAYGVNILVTGDGESVALGNTVALVGNAPRGGAAVGGLKFTENVTETKKVGVFSRGTAPGGVTFTAVINWGDGTPTSTGTLTTNTFGMFDITGTHNYVDEGTYNGTITVTGSDGIVNTFPMVVVVDDRAVNLTPVNVVAQTGIQVTNVTVATFTDPGGPKAPGAYTAQIDWGDGTSVSLGAITYNAGTQTFTVSGTHTYAAAGIYPMTVTVNHGSAPAAVVSPTATVTDGAILPAVNATAVNVAANVNVAATNVLVATFTDPNGPDIVGNYSAVINWGDGSPTDVGTITYNAGTQVFSVTGTHTWTAAGTYNMTVTINHGASPDAVVFPIATVTVGSNITTTTPAVINGVEGRQLTNVLVGSFSSANAAAVPSDFTSLIVWGDGTPNTPGTIVRTGPGLFQVRASHTFFDDGTYAVQVRVTPNGQTMVPIDSTAIIADATLAGISRLFTATRNANFSGIVGYVTDGNTFDTNPAEKTVTINWGDGTAVTAGTVTYNATSKRFELRGTHRYTTASPTGGFKLIITVIDGLSQVRINSTATVA